MGIKKLLNQYQKNKLLTLLESLALYFCCNQEILCWALELHYLPPYSDPSHPSPRLSVPIMDANLPALTFLTHDCDHGPVFLNPGYTLELLGIFKELKKKMTLWKCDLDMGMCRAWVFIFLLMSSSNLNPLCGQDKEQLLRF